MSGWSAFLTAIICGSFGAGVTLLAIYIGEHWDDEDKK